MFRIFSWMAVLSLTCPSYICPSGFIVFFTFWFCLGSFMSIFWKEWKTTENKYSLIEYISPLSHCSAFMLTRALIPTQSLYFCSTPVSLKSSPRLLQYNRYHLTCRDLFLPFLEHLCPVSLSYTSSFSLLYPYQSSLLFHDLVAGCQPVRKMRLQSISASQGGLWPQGPTP